MREIIFLIVLLGFHFNSFGQNKTKDLNLATDTLYNLFMTIKYDSGHNVSKLRCSFVDSSNYTILSPSDTMYCTIESEYKKDRYWWIYSTCLESELFKHNGAYRKRLSYVRHGKYYYYSSQGKLISAGNYENGKRMKYRIFDYHNNGMIWTITQQFKNDNHGSDSVFYDTGDLAYVAEYVHGKMMKIHSQADPFGSKFSSPDFHDGNGEVIFYNPCFARQESIYYRDGKLDRKKNRRTKREKKKQNK